MTGPEGTRVLEFVEAAETMSRRFTVYYSDGTTETYTAEGNWDSLTPGDYPGELLFLYFNYTNYIDCVYTYTENGVTSDEFSFHSYPNIG